jgi:NADPH:quinone reductase-like Zn-dependent oxidoreductase
VKAFVLDAYGCADRLALAESTTPVPGDDEVLVRIRATSVNPYDWHLMRGEPYLARLMAGDLGVRRPKINILGADVAGTVEAIGGNVTGFQPGDDVYALLAGGGFAEYATVREGLLARMPRNLSYEQAAPVPMAGVTALLSLREAGRLRAGQHVLVNGASGGVGTFCVQLARALGAKVTGVCGARNAELVRSIGADEVVDYAAEDFTRAAQRYDLVVDIAGSRPVRACLKVLTPKGALVVVGGPAGRWIRPANRMISALALAPFVSQRIVTADAVGYADKQRALSTLTDFIEEGKVTPVVDRQYAFADLPAAIGYQEQGHAPGKVVVTV